MLRRCHQTMAVPLFNGTKISAVELRRCRPGARPSRAMALAARMRVGPWGNAHDHARTVHADSSEVARRARRRAGRLEMLRSRPHAVLNHGDLHAKSDSVVSAVTTTTTGAANDDDWTIDSGGCVSTCPMDRLGRFGWRSGWSPSDGLAAGSPVSFFFSSWPRGQSVSLGAATHCCDVSDRKVARGRSARVSARARVGPPLDLPQLPVTRGVGVPAGDPSCNLMESRCRLLARKQAMQFFFLLLLCLRIPKST